MKLLRLVNNVERLTMAEPVTAPRKKEIIPALIGAAVAIGSTAFGAAASASARRKSERMQRAQEAKEDAWYNRRYNEDYADTAAGQNLIRRAKEFSRENWRKAAGAQAVAGGTAAATQMAKDAGNKMMGDTLANIAATDQQSKSHVDNLHRQAEMGFTQQDMAREEQRGQNIAQAAAGVANAAMSAGSALSQGGTRTTDIGSGGDNNSKVVSETPATPPVSMEDNAVLTHARVFNGGVEPTDAEKLHFRNAIFS